MQVDEALGELGSLSSDSKTKTPTRTKKKGKSGHEGTGGIEARLRTPSIDGGVDKTALTLSVGPTSSGMSLDSFEQFPPAMSARRSSFQSADPFSALTSRNTLPVLKTAGAIPVSARVSSPPQLTLSTSPPSQSNPIQPSVGVVVGGVGGGGGGDLGRRSSSGGSGVGSGIGGGGSVVSRSCDDEADVFEIAPFAISMDLFGSEDVLSSPFMTTPAFHNLHPPVSHYLSSFTLWLIYLSRR